MNFLPSASKLGLAANHCAFPWATHAPRWPKSEMSKAANFGMGIHEVAQLTSEGEAVDRDAIATKWGVEGAERKRWMLVAHHVIAWCEKYVEPTDDVERAVAYDVVTGAARMLDRGKHRDYKNIGKNELTGTFDLATSRPVSGLTVWDWKTGEVDDAADSMQLAFHGLALARLRGVDRVRVGYLLATENGVEDVSADLDELDLGDVASRLRALVANAWSATPKPGPHCGSMWCPIVSVCPATKAALLAIEAASEMTLPLTIEITSPEHAVHTRVRLKMVEKAVESIDAALKAYVREHGPIEVSPGRTWGERIIDKETVDIGVDGAYAALVEHYGQDVADVAVSLSTSKAELHRVAPSKDAEKRLLNSLRAIGAIRSTPYPKFEERTVNKKEAANG